MKNLISRSTIFLSVLVVLSLPSAVRASDTYQFLVDQWPLLWGVEFQPGQSFLQISRELRPGQFEVKVWGNDPPQILGTGIYVEHSRGANITPDGTADFRPAAGILTGSTEQSVSVFVYINRISTGDPNEDVVLIVPMVPMHFSIEERLVLANNEGNWDLKISNSLPLIRINPTSSSEDSICDELLPVCANGYCHDPDPDNEPEPNGCGAAEGLSQWAPNLSFGGCCDIHDIFYGTCNPTEAHRTNADSQWFDCMNDECSQISWLLYPVQMACYSASSSYFGLVSLFGEGPFCSAQAEACVCCED